MQSMQSSLGCRLVLIVTCRHSDSVVWCRIRLKKQCSTALLRSSTTSATVCMGLTVKALAHALPGPLRMRRAPHDVAARAASSCSLRKSERPVLVSALHGGAGPSSTRIRFTPAARKAAQYTHTNDT